MGTEIETLIQSWRRDLRARNLAKRTIETYVDSADQLATWLAEHDQAVTSWAAVTRGQVSDFITHLIETRSASTASVPTGPYSSSSTGSWPRKRSTPRRWPR